MEPIKNYPGRRWEIVYGAFAGMEQHAVELVQAAVKRYIPYIVPLYKQPTGKANVLYVGTKKSNPFIAALLRDVTLPDDGTFVKVFGEGEDQRIIVAGGSESACYYAATEFVDDYLPEARRRPYGNPFFKKLFLEPFPVYEHRAVPMVKERGLWTWGHVIYDYRAYLQNMARLKLNKVTVWNDFAPINGGDFVAYAHSLGIRVIWGYSWIWDEKPEEVVTDPEVRQAWKERILNQYTEQYAHLGGDGIYFQTFTETGAETIEGRNRAECAVEWVNEVAAALLAQYPDLRIEFGLHASSVRNHLDEIAKTDPRLSIIWEDCGSFPYAYGAHDIGPEQETAEFSEKIAALRGGRGFGAVLKGQVWLDWSAFEHQTGPYLLGVSEKQEILEKLQLRRDFMRHQQSYWLENGQTAFRILRLLAEKTGGTAELSGLLEDSLFEEKIWLPSALFAEMLWDGESTYEQIVGKVSRRECVE